MIRVLHVITALHSGGAETMVAKLTGAMDRSRFSSMVVPIVGGGMLEETIRQNGTPVNPLGIAQGLPDPRAIQRLRRIVKRFQPHIVQSWLYHADLLCLVALAAGSPGRLLWNVRCSDMRPAGSARVLTRLLARFSDRPDVVVVNSLAGQRLHKSLGYQPREWAVIPNGFDLDRFRPDVDTRTAVRRELSVPNDAFVVGHLARFDPMKDHATLLAAAARLRARVPNMRLVLAGKGTEAGSDAMTQLIVQNGMSEAVTRLGERRDIDRLFPAFDTLALSSAYGEGFPNVLGEAMASGVPCIATDVGDSALVISTAGTSVPPRDPVALAAGLIGMANLTPEARAALGDRARRLIAEHFSLAAVAAAYETLYARVAAAEGRPPMQPLV